MTTTHPFGRENEVSIERLLRFFCNNVNLGQWELARACVVDLHNQNKLTKTQIKELLEEIARNPYGYCEGSTTIQGQNALSWLAFQEYKDIEDDMVKKEWLKQEIEFRLLLVENCADATQEVLQDLCKYHRRALDYKLNITHSENRVSVPFAHQQTQLFISNTLSTKPLLGYSLIKALRVDGLPQFLENNSQLTRLHLGCLQTQLLILNRSLDLPTEFLELLSLFEPSEDEYEELRVKDFLRELSEFVKKAGSDALSQIYARLIGKNSTILLDQFAVIHSESQRASTRLFEDTLSSSQNSNASRLPLTSKDQISYIDLYWSMLKHEQHFLETVVLTSLDFVRQGNFEELSALMNKPEWRPLRPLVLLLAWDLCPHPDVAKQLLSVLHDPTEESDNVLAGAGKRLEHQIDLLNWCLDRARSLGHHDDRQVSLYRTPTMFHNMEMRSVLQMLHHCGLLSSLDETEVFDMLSKMPSISLKESIKAAKKEKTVRFADEESESLKNDSSKINVAQEKDIAIYRSFCALKNFIDALHFCKDTVHWQVFSKQGNIRSKNCGPKFCLAGFTDALSSILKNEDVVTLQADLSVIQCNLQELQKLYDKKVTKLLKEGQEHISKLLPLNYRVEVLEDVFALLFTTYEDLQDSNQSDSGEEGITSSRNTSQQTSRENLSSVGSVTSEAPPDGSLLSTTESSFHGRSGSTSPASPGVQSVGEPSFSSAAEASPSLVVPSKSEMFSISKTELQDCQQTKRDKKLSGNLSGNSTNSLHASSRMGYVANEFFIRDLLGILKNCMAEVNKVRFALQGQSKENATSMVNLEMDEALRDSLQSSIAPKDLQSRISRLQQCISEAQWRFQLVAHDWLPSEVGSVMVDLNKLKNQHLMDDDIRIPVGDSGRRRKRSKRLNSKQDSEDGAPSTGESESVIGTTDESTTDPCSPRLKKRQNIKMRTSTAEVLLEHLSKIGDGVIHDMLLPPDDLLNSCLKRGKFGQAEQIIKMFCMQDSEAAGEVTFAAQFLQAVKKLQGLNGKSKFNRSNSIPLQTPTAKGKLSVLKPSLSLIANVAAAGLQSSSASSIVDQVLSLTNLPKMGSINKKGLTGDTSPPISHATDVHLAVMIILDLACSSCRSWESSLNLLEMALVRRQTQSSPTENRDNAKNLQSSGIEAFLDNLVQLVKLGSEVQDMDEAQQRYFTRSIMQILTTGSLPLQVFDITLLHNTTKTLGLALRNVARTYADLYLQNATDILQETSKPAAGCRSVVIKTKPALRQAMKQLVQTADEAIPGGGMTNYMLRFHMKNKDVEPKSHRYLGSLYSYVKLVSTIIHNLQNDKPKAGHLLSVEYFKVLDQSPTEIFGKLMFHWHVPPSRVEREMGDMKISLPQVILNACCPKVMMNIPMKKSMMPGTTKSYPEMCGRRLLNNGLTHSETVKHPEQLVRELLTRVVILLKEKSSMDNPQGLFTLDVAKILIDDAQLNDILLTTRDLRNADLALLADKEQKLSFYGNLVNLMTFHVWIAAIQDHIKSVRKQFLRNRFGTSVDLSLRSVRSLTFDDHDLDLKSLLPSSELDWVMHEDKWVYKVGQLGIVSLFELKYIILRAGLPPPSRHSNLVQARCCYIDANDPWQLFGPPMESRMTFVLAEGHISSPPLQVLSPEMVTSQLRRSLKEYLRCSVSAERADKVVILPQLLVWYRTDFVSEGRKDAKKFESLLEFVSSQVDEAVASDLNSLLDSYGSSPKSSGKSKSDSVQIHVNPFSNDFGMTFDFDQFKACQPQCIGIHKRRNSLQFNLSMSAVFSASAGDHKQDLSIFMPRTDKTMFDITQSTLEYLAFSSGDLMAVLASLMSNDGADDSTQTGVTPQYTEDSSSASSAVIIETLPLFTEFVKSFKHDKLSQFVPLQQHLHTYILPLENADSNSALTDDIVSRFSQNTLKESTRKALLVPPSHESYTSQARTVLKESTNAHEWDKAVHTLQSLPQSAVKSSRDFIQLHDFVLFCASQAKDGSDINKKAQYTLAIINPLCRVRSVLGLLSNVTVDVALHLLRTCESALYPEDPISKTLQTKLKHFIVYDKIIESTKTQLSKLSPKPTRQSIRMMSNSAEDKHLLEKLVSWQGIVSQSEEDPDSVLDVILQSHDFNTARDWAKIHDVRKEIFQIIEEKFICYLLEKSSSDYLEAYRVLESLKAESWELCLKVCEDLLKNLTNKQNVLYVAQFMLDQLDGDRGHERSLSPSRVSQLNLLILGCKMLLHLPSEIRGLYEHLIASPVLLLEQLLMNMKVEHVGKMLKRMQMEIKAAEEEDFSISACDALLVMYATKALEFSVCKTYDSSTEVEPVALSRSQSRASLVSTSSGTPQMSQITAPPGSTSKSSHVTSRLVVSGSTDDMSRFLTNQKIPRSESTPSFSPYKVSASPGSTLVSPPSGLPLHSPGALTPGRKLMTATSRGYSISPQVRSPPNSGSPKFVMPLEPPPKNQWVPDEAVTHCMVCQSERFSMFNRRHHCRKCGRVVCGNCSTHATSIGGFSARTCDDCYGQIYKTRGDSPGHKQNSNSPATESTISKLEEIPESPETLVGFSTEYQYILVLENELNEATREEFYYDQAPSTSLCLSILDLLSDQKDYGKVILSLVDEMSKLLQPLAPGVKNPEVDYSLVISMLKYLLFYAKVKLQKLGDNAGVELCDQYLGRLDLLKLLVMDNCPYIPSMQQLTKLDSLRRLRDKLIEEERLSLAMEVSTKCGIDPAGVWAAWGMTCLSAGDLSTARDKFSKCLKAPKDKNQGGIQLKLLSDIIDYLENHHNSNVENVLSPLNSMAELLADPPQIRHEDSQIDEVIMQECLNYLRNYGNHLSIVSFYMKHCRLSTAINYCKEMKVTPDVFVEGVVVDALRRGQVQKVLDCLSHTDPTLESWASQLNATCRHLNKNKLIHSLYQVQIFMKDFIRAAMTCITYFYQGGATSYSDLSTRVHHLLNAKQHLESYLDDRQWGTVLRAPGGGTRSTGKGDKHPDILRMIMTPGEVNKYVNTINLQMEVTKFLQRYYENLDVVMTGLASRVAAAAGATSSRNLPPDKGLPTLFGSTKTKTEVVLLVLLSGNNVNDGFGLAFRIIQDFKLDSTSIYVQAARYLGNLQQYSAVKQLLSCIQDSGLCTDQAYDEVVTGAIEVMGQLASEGKEVEQLIKMIRSDSKRVHAYIKCGKLKSAYLIAVKRNDEAAIRLISRYADKLGQSAVKTICDKWLQQKDNN